MRLIFSLLAFFCFGFAVCYGSNGLESYEEFNITVKARYLEVNNTPYFFGEDKISSNKFTSYAIGAGYIFNLAGIFPNLYNAAELVYIIPAKNTSEHNEASLKGVYAADYIGYGFHAGNGLLIVPNLGFQIAFINLEKTAKEQGSTSTIGTGGLLLNLGAGLSATYFWPGEQKEKSMSGYSVTLSARAFIMEDEDAIPKYELGLSFGLPKWF